MAHYSPLANRFLNTVKAGGLTNPYGLAAVYSTGTHESGWNPSNVWGEWDDPSEGGEPGQAGGAMSWRAGRLNNLREFARSHGDDPRRPAIETQAEFFLSEDPSLIEALQGASNATEAQRAMDKAWRFAGYDRPGGESARRLQTTQQTLGEILGGETSVTPTGGGGADTVENTMATGKYPSLGPVLHGPQNRSQLLAQVLENMQEDARRPNPKSWGETGLRALAQGIKGYVGGQKLRAEDAEEQKQREVLAGILEGNPQAARLLQSDIGDMDSWESAVLKQAFTEPEKPDLPSSVREFEYAQENPDFAEYQRGATKPSARDRQAHMLMETGVPEDIAKGIASGRFVVSRHPTSEVAQVVDKATGRWCSTAIPRRERPPRRRATPKHLCQTLRRREQNRSGHRTFPRT